MLLDGWLLEELAGLLVDDGLLEELLEEGLLDELEDGLLDELDEVALLLDGLLEEALVLVGLFELLLGVKEELLDFPWLELLGVGVRELLLGWLRLEDDGIPSSFEEVTLLEFKAVNDESELPANLKLHAVVHNAISVITPRKSFLFFIYLTSALLL